MVLSDNFCLQYYKKYPEFFFILAFCNITKLRKLLNTFTSEIQLLINWLLIKSVHLFGSFGCTVRIIHSIRFFTEQGNGLRMQYLHLLHKKNLQNF